ncbi:MAG: response regulator transcription factor [Candidatus Binataceae bacterium]|nr:response regulator transcription factor [Candidatus Binataceae bacterium]
MNPSIRVAIADDHALFRQGLKSLLLLQSELEVVAEIETAGQIAQTLDSFPCDILLLDLQMDLWTLPEIQSLARTVRIVVLTASERIEDAMAALKAGARAIVQKRFAVETLMEAIRAAFAGFIWMPPSVQAEIASQWESARANRLTARESEIITCVASGLRNAEVAERLSITEATVKTHLNNIFQKLGLRDRVELTLYAFRSGLIEPQRPTR